MLGAPQPPHRHTPHGHLTDTHHAEPHRHTPRPPHRHTPRPPHRHTHTHTPTLYHVSVFAQQCDMLLAGLAVQLSLLVQNYTHCLTQSLTLPHTHTHLHTPSHTHTPPSHSLTLPLHTHTTLH